MCVMALITIWTLGNHVIRDLGRNASEEVQDKILYILLLKHPRQMIDRQTDRQTDRHTHTHTHTHTNKQTTGQFQLLRLKVTQNL